MHKIAQHVNSLLRTQAAVETGRRQQPGTSVFVNLCLNKCFLQATSSKVKELSCLEVEKVSPTLRGSVSQLRDGVEEQNAKLLTKEQAKATKAQKKHARMQLSAK